MQALSLVPDVVGCIHHTDDQAAMKYLFLFLLSTPAFAASVHGHLNISVTVVNSCNVVASPDAVRTRCPSKYTQAPLVQPVRPVRPEEVRRYGFTDKDRLARVVF